MQKGLETGQTRYTCKEVCVCVEWKEAAHVAFANMLEARGVTRRDFMKLCGTVAAAAGLSQLTVPQVAQALETSVIGATKGNLYPVIWVEGASCTGCTESFAQAQTPNAAEVVLDMISLNYSETLSAAAGYSMEEAKEQTIEAGDYILIYEGAIQEKWGGNALRVAGKPGTEHLIEAAKTPTPWSRWVPAPSTAVGWAQSPTSPMPWACSSTLRRPASTCPSSTSPGCPANPEWLTSVLVDVVLMKLKPADLDLNSEGKPAGIFNQTIHDNCERRGHFENGEFVYEFGSKEEEMGYCLYPVGCKGPQTRALCGVTLWNNRRSWCVQSGAPLHRLLRGQPEQPGRQLGRGEHPVLQAHARPAHRSSEPAAHHHRRDHHRHRGGALVVHGFGMKLSGRMDGGAPFEKIRKWDAKHPDQEIGTYADPVAGGPVLDDELLQKNAEPRNND